MRTRTALGWMLVLTSTAGVTACGGDKGGGGNGRVGIGRAALTRAMSCDDLLTMLQADAITKENIRIDAMLAERRRYSQGGPGHGAPGRGAPIADDAFGDTPGAPASGGQDADNGGEAGKGASDYSRTNTQVDGVDEADIVKTDGKSIYLVHGGRFFILNAWPAAELAENASVEIEGEPIEMFVEKGRALVYSSVNGDPIYEAAGIEPKGQFGYGSGYYGDVDIGGAEPGMPTDVADVPGKPGSYGRTRLLKITVLSLDDAEPAVLAEHWLEGDYRSSRRMGAKVRTVLQGGAHGPMLQNWPLGSYADYRDYESGKSIAEVEAAFEQLRRDNVAKIGATTLSDWLPNEMRREGQAIVASTPACESFYVPTAGTTESGLVQVRSLDWTAPSQLGGVSIMGRADHVYANESAMYLAAAAWNQGYAYEALLALPADQNISVPANRTHVHKLDLATSPDEPLYVASGTVTGTILDQFSLDEHQGRLRIATTEDRFTFWGSQSGGGDSTVGVGVSDPADGDRFDEPGFGGTGGSSGDQDGGSSEPMPTPEERIGKQSAALGASAPPPSRVNRLFVLETQGSELVTVGDVGELAPNERIYSARFVGAKGYLVTFRQVDPLFVIDLSNAAAPKVLGELEIPGFSNYMHPIDDGHLLTIGQDAGVTNGLAVQLFDVSVPTSPQLKSKHVFSAPWGYSEAQHNHKAFTWYPSRKLLAFPYTGYDNMGARSSLELISVDTTSGVTPFGSIDHSGFFEQTPNGYCGGYYGISVRRGLFLDDVVFSISYGGVMAHELSELATPIASLPLTEPISSHYACGWGG